MSWVNAGHPEPLLLREGKLVKTLQVEPNLPLGLSDIAIDGPTPSIATESLQPGDSVLFYTDGAIESRARTGDPSAGNAWSTYSPRT